MKSRTAVAGRGVNMAGKIMRFPEDVLSRAAAQAGETMAEYVAGSVAVSVGRMVRAELVGVSGGVASFVIS